MSGKKLVIPVSRVIVRETEKSVVDLLIAKSEQAQLEAELASLKLEQAQLEAATNRFLAERGVIIASHFTTPDRKSDRNGIDLSGRSEGQIVGIEKIQSEDEYSWCDSWIDEGYNCQPGAFSSSDRRRAEATTLNKLIDEAGR